MGSGKSGSAQKSLNYYGTIAAVCAWRLDWLTAIVINGNYQWQCSSSGPLDLTAPGALTADGYIDMSGSLLDPSMLMEGGYFHIYPGVATANAPAELSGHPAMRMNAGWVAKHLFYGQDSGTAPNVQLIGGAKPIVPTTIVAAADNVVDDRQVNPVACAAEIILDERGYGLDETELDAASWLAAAHWCAQDQAHRNYSFMSPLFSEQLDLRDIVKQLLEPINGYLRWTDDGKLGCYIYEWGTNPGGLITVDARHRVEDQETTDGDWVDVPTSVDVTFTDRGFEFQGNSVNVPDQSASDIRQIEDPQKLQREHVTRSWQAYAQGLEWIRRMGMAPGTGQVLIRGPIVANLQPGDKFFIDDDPEPGGAASAQLVRVDKVQFDRTDKTTIDFTVDPLLPATAYTPSWTSPLPESLFAGAIQTVPSLAHLQTIPLPPAYFGWPPAVGFLTTRPSGIIAGFHAYFATAGAGPYTELGPQFGFAARCQLVTGVGTGDGTLRLQLLDGAAGPDAYIASETPGGNVSAAQDNQLLAILISLDGSGRVALDAGGQPVMEFASILQRTAVTTDTHDYTVYRGRCGLAALAWGAGAAAWIIPLTSLTEWRHDLYETMFGQTGYFRLASFSSAAVDESSPLPESDLVFPSIPVPNNLTAANGTGKAVQLDWLFNSSANFSGEYGVYRATGPAYTDWAKIGEVHSTRFNDHTVVLGTAYQYKISAITEGEQESAFSNVVSITVPSVLASDVDPTAPNDPGAATLVGSGTYVAKDGSVHSYLMIRVPQLPAAGGGKVAAVEQDVYYRIAGTGAVGWTLQDQPENTAGTEDIRIDDLPPGSSIEVVSIGYSKFGIKSTNTVAATGSPFTAPVKTTAPTAPTGSLVPETLAPAIQPTAGLIAWGCRATITIPGDLDITGLVVKATHTDSDAATDYDWCENMDGSRLVTRPAAPGQTIVVSLYYGSVSVSPGYVRVAVKDSSGNLSAWTRLGACNANAAQAVKDMSLQPRSNPQMSGVQIGGSAYSASASTTNTDGWDTGIYTTVGGSAREKFYISLPGGFSAKPKTGDVELNSDWTGGGVKVDFSYDYDDAGNSSTQAAVYIESHDGVTALPVQSYRYKFRFNA